MATEHEPVLITEPGIRDDLSNEDYHLQVHWLGSSQLKGYLPEWFKPAGTSTAFDLGTLVHALVLEPDKPLGFVALNPDEIGVKADGTPADNPRSTKAWREAVAEAEARGQTVIERATWDAAHNMADALTCHPIASRLLAGEGWNEQSLFWCDDDGVPHRARPDRRISGALIDLKTTAALPSADALARAVCDFGYDLSAVHYDAVARGLELDAPAFIHIWVTKTYPYRVTVTEMDAAFWDRGEALRRLAIRRATDATEPRYQGAAEPLTLTAPPWALRGIPA